MDVKVTSHELGDGCDAKVTGDELGVGGSGGSDVGDELCVGDS